MKTSLIYHKKLKFNYNIIKKRMSSSFLSTFFVRKIFFLCL
ncbi:hypothetical protein GMMP15_1030003 [Candidatus Magnetomoraceae bacterium gMMP-15]